MKDNELNRFVDLVRAEAETDEDFVRERVMKTPLYKALKGKYDNIDELLEGLLKKSTLYGRVEEAVKEIDKQNSRISIRETIERRGERIATILSWRDKQLYDKFCWRFSRDEIKKIALKTIPKNETMVEKEETFL